MTDKTRLRDALMRLSMAVAELREMSHRDYAGMNRKYPKIMAELNEAQESANALLRDVIGAKKAKARP